MTASFVALGAVADIQLGKMLSPNAKTGGASWPYLRNANVQWGRLELGDMSEMDFSDDERVKFSIERGDLLVCEGGEPGRCAVVDRDLPGVYFQKALMRVRPNSRQIDVRYLQHFMAYAAGRGAFTKGGNQATIAHFPAVRLSAFEVPLLPIFEQRRIADVLDKADAIRRKREQAIALSDELLRSVFLEMFADDGKYPATTIGVVCDVGGGLQVSAARSGDIVVPYLRVANVHRDRLDLSEIKSMRVTPSEIERTALAPGDVLVVEGHGNAEELGRAAVWTGSVSPCVHQNHLIRVRCCELVLPEFVSACLNGPFGRDQMLRRGNTTSGLNTISASAVRSVTIPLPPIAHQQKFSDRVAHVRKLRDRQLAASECGDIQFKGLASLLFKESSRGSHGKV